VSGRRGALVCRCFTSSVRWSWICSFAVRRVASLVPMSFAVAVSTPALPTLAEGIPSDCGCVVYEEKRWQPAPEGPLLGNIAVPWTSTSKAT
jgi:hypothetical protein